MYYTVCHVVQRNGALDFTAISDSIDDVVEAVNLCNAYRKIETGEDKFYVIDESGCFVDELKVERENIIE